MLGLNFDELHDFLFDEVDEVEEMASTAEALSNLLGMPVHILRLQAPHARIEHVSDASMVRSIERLLELYMSEELDRPAHPDRILSASTPEAEAVLRAAQQVGAALKKGMIAHMKDGHYRVLEEDSGVSYFLSASELRPAGEEFKDVPPSVGDSVSFYLRPALRPDLASKHVKEACEAHFTPASADDLFSPSRFRRADFLDFLRHTGVLDAIPPPVLLDGFGQTERERKLVDQAIAHVRRSVQMSRRPRPMVMPGWFAGTVLSKLDERLQERHTPSYSSCRSLSAVAYITVHACGGNVPAYISSNDCLKVIPIGSVVYFRLAPDPQNACRVAAVDVMTLRPVAHEVHDCPPAAAVAASSSSSVSAASFDSFPSAAAASSSSSRVSASARPRFEFSATAAPFIPRARLPAPAAAAAAASSSSVQYSSSSSSCAPPPPLSVSAASSYSSASAASVAAVKPIATAKTAAVEKESHSSSSGSAQCIVCMDHAREVLFLNCMHICCCSACAEKIDKLSRKCPYCNQSYASIVRVHLC